MNICITILELRKALAELEQCEERGFSASVGVFELTSVGKMLRDTRMSFVDTWDAVDESSAKDWGRQGVAKRFRFDPIDGLVPCAKDGSGPRSGVRSEAQDDPHGQPDGEAGAPKETDQGSEPVAKTMKMVNDFRWAHDHAVELATSTHGPMPEGHEDDDEPDTPWHCFYNGAMTMFGDARALYTHPPKADHDRPVMDSAWVINGCRETWRAAGYKNPDRAAERFRSLYQAWACGWHEARLSLVNTTWAPQSIKPEQAGKVLPYQAVEHVLADVEWAAKWIKEKIGGDGQPGIVERLERDAEWLKTIHPHKALSPSSPVDPSKLVEGIMEHVGFMERESFNDDEGRWQWAVVEIWSLRHIAWQKSIGAAQDVAKTLNHSLRSRLSAYLEEQRS